MDTRHRDRMPQPYGPGWWDCAAETAGVPQVRSLAEYMAVVSSHLLARDAVALAHGQSRRGAPVVANLPSTAPAPEPRRHPGPARPVQVQPELAAAPEHVVAVPRPFLGVEVVELGREDAGRQALAQVGH